MSDSEDTIDDEPKKFKTGLIHLSHIPDGLNVRLLRTIMSEHGLVGRIYLKPDKKKHEYIEGWVEFKKKRVAKQVAELLNGTEVVWGKKRSKLNGQVWSIEYLHRFKWTDLVEQQTYQSKFKESRRKLAMTQAKKVSNFYEKIYRSQKPSKEV